MFLSALDRALIRHVLNFVWVKNLQTAPVDSFYGPLSIKADKMYSYIFLKKKYKIAMTSHSASQKVIINHYYKIFQIHFLYSLRKHPFLLALCTTTFQFIIRHYKCLRLTRLHDNIVEYAFQVWVFCPRDSLSSWRKSQFHVAPKKGNVYIPNIYVS